MEKEIKIANGFYVGVAALLTAVMLLSGNITGYLA